MKLACFGEAHLMLLTLLVGLQDRPCGTRLEEILSTEELSPWRLGAYAWARVWFAISSGLLELHVIDVDQKTGTSARGTKVSQIPWPRLVVRKIPSVVLRVRKRVTRRKEWTGGLACLWLELRWLVVT